MIAFWVDQEGEARVEIAVGFADGADVDSLVGTIAGQARSARHF
jgi:hypothetical protein